MTDKNTLIKDKKLPSTNSSSQFSSITQIFKKYKSQDVYSVSPKKYANQTKKNSTTNDNSVSTPIKFQTAVKDSSSNSSKTNIMSLRAMTSNKKLPDVQRNQLNTLDDKEPIQTQLDHSVSQYNQPKKHLHTSLDKIMSDGSFQELDTEGNINSIDEEDEMENNSPEINKDISCSSINEKSNPLENKIKKRIPQIAVNPFMIQEIVKQKKLETSPNNSISKNSIDHYQRQFLLAAKKGDKETFLDRLEKIFELPNGDINYCDESKFTALHYACDEGNLKIVEILIKANCDINVKNINSRTPLHLSSIHGYFDISKLLIENGSNINQVDNEKNSPLHLCAIGGHVELLKYFVDKLPQADQKNIYGKMPHDLATKHEVKELLSTYLAKNEGKYHKVKIHTTTDQNLNKMFRHMNNGQMPPSNQSANMRMTGSAQKTPMNTTTTTNTNFDNSHTINTQGNYIHSIGNQNNININIQANINSSTSNRVISTTKKGKVHNKVNVTVKTNIDSKQYKVDNIPKTTSNRLNNQTTNSLTKKYSINNFSINSPLSKNQANKKSDTKISNDKLQKTKTLAAFSTQKNKKKNVIFTTKTDKPNQPDFNKNERENTQMNVSSDNFHLNKTEDEYSKKKNGLHIDTEETEMICSQLHLNSIEEEKITPSSFICLALLGRGSFGEVYLVEKINSNSLYAMKVLSKDRISSQNLIKYAMAERNVLSLTNHPFIVKLNYAFQTANKLFLILDYCENGDLAKHLYREKRFAEERAKFYLCEIILALEDLHKRDVIFRDLKPDNVVLDEEGHARLTDFGLSKEGVFDSNCAKSFCGSIAYLAPEMLKRKGHGKAVDWYLLGVLFYEMLVGIPPFFTEQREEIFRNIEYAELQIPKFINKDASDLLRALLQKDPNKRLGGSERDAEEVKEHNYFSNVDWQSIYDKKIPPPKIKKCNKAIQIYAKPRMFQTDEEKGIPDEVYLNGWSFINNDENNF